MANFTRLIFFAAAAAVSVSLSGCATPLNRVTFDRYMDSGWAAEQSGDLSAAEEAYRRAYLNTQWGNLSNEEEEQSLGNLARIKYRLGKRTESHEIRNLLEQVRHQLYVAARTRNLGKAEESRTAYNLGLTKRDLCKADEAEKLLLEALQLDERVTGPESRVTSMRLFELGRLYHDLALPEKAVPLFERGIRMVKEELAKSDPIALADAIAEHAKALQSIGRNDEAIAAQREANKLRENNPGKKAKFVPDRYAQTCRT